MHWYGIIPFKWFHLWVIPGNHGRNILTFFAVLLMIHYFEVAVILAMN
jgi:hypothetical protein